MRKLKLIGLAALAVLAVSAVSASAASAAEGTAVVTGAGGFTAAQVGTHTFTLPGGRTLSCVNATFSGTVANEAKTVTATPSYTNCSAKVGETVLPATVEVTECTYSFSDLTTTAANTYAAKTNVVCPGETAIHIKLYSSHTTHTAGTRLCEYTVKPQLTGAGVHFTVSKTIVEEKEVKDVNITATKVAVSLTRTFGTAGNCGEATSNSEYNGNTLLTPAVGTTITIDD